MKISFDLEESDVSGKHKFISRLREAFKTRDYTEVPMGSRADVHLFVNKHDSTAKCNIFRLDGIWVNTKDKNTEAKNKAIRHKIKHSQGVIYQNEFCKLAVQRLLGYDHKNSACILNGADAREFEVEPYTQERPYFLAMCKWRPHKRLKETVLGFVDANLKDHDLIILGDAGEEQCQLEDMSSRVKFLGWQDRESTAKFLRGCVATVHLCYLDWCPNSVVESLIAGKPVIHTNSGGTPYIVKHRGYCVHESEWNMKPTSIYSPPALPWSVVSENYIKAARFPIGLFDTSDINIENIASQYDTFIKETVKRG